MTPETNETVANKMTLEDLFINIKSVSRVQPHEKLSIVDKNFLVIDHRSIQWLTRWFTGDNRKTVMAFIQGLILRIGELIQGNEKEINYEDKSKLIRLLPMMQVGLDNLKQSYEDDRIVIFTLENIIDSLEKILDGWAKKMIAK
jgi:hypothetical protein